MLSAGPQAHHEGGHEKQPRHLAKQRGARRAGNEDARRRQVAVEGLIRLETRHQRQHPPQPEKGLAPPPGEQFALDERRDR